MSRFGDMFYATVGSQMGIVNQTQVANLFGCNSAYNTGGARPYGNTSYCNSIFTAQQNAATRINCAQKTGVWLTLGNNLLSGVFNLFGSVFNGLTSKGLGAISNLFS